MNRSFQLVAALLAALLPALSQPKGGPRSAPPPRSTNVAPPRPNAAGPRAGAGVGQPKLGPPVANPGAIITHLYTAGPEERERVLEKLPPDRQEQARRALQAFDNLPKEQQDLRIRQAQVLESLPPEKRRQFQESWRAFRALPQDRFNLLRRALRQFQVMPEDRRNRILNSDEFKTRFSPEEQKIILDLWPVMVASAR